MAFARILETPRLVLRDPRPGDAPAIFDAYGSDPMVMRYLGWRAHAGLADTSRQIGHDIHRWLKGSAWVWVMTRKADVGVGVGGGGPAEAQPVFGQVELIPMSHPSDQAHHLRLGCMMGASQWGQGLMQEALSVVLAAAFAQPAVWRVDALCDVDNARSAALLARLGMRQEGRLGRALVHPNVATEPRDAWLYALTRDEVRAC